jgi:hypothetical protein
MQERFDRRVRDWLYNKPRLLESYESKEAVLRQAWGLCGAANVGLEDFTAALKRAGYEPRPVRRGHADAVTCWQFEDQTRGPARV